MQSDRVVVQVESNFGEDGPLTVADALHQFSDAFDLLAAAIAEEPGGDKIRWRLEELSKNSPATAVGVAFSDDPEISLAPLVMRGKQLLSRSLEELTQGVFGPWLEKRVTVVSSLLQRNLSGVGKTVIDLGGNVDRVVIVERVARRALETIERYQAITDIDKARSEYGSIDAYVSEARRYHGKPAIYVKDRLTQRLIPCILSDELAEDVGRTHSWQDAWSGKRVSIKGHLFYDRSGVLSRISATGLSDIVSREVEFQKLRGTDFLSGKTPSEHLSEFWGDDDS
jgi:hypothetical protein